MARVAVIGAGFAGLSAACTLADAGMDVTVVEKHGMSGGRARKFEASGFTFDMGPSWYWMPDVFERFFARFGRNVSDFYALKRLNPSYRVVYAQGDTMDIPADLQELKHLFESIEAGSGETLESFLQEARDKYVLSMEDLVYRPGLSLMELFDVKILKEVPRMQLFRSMRSITHRAFQDSRLRQLLEFPVLFLGAKPSETPALYSLMNYADMCLGTWYPQGGFYQVVAGIESLARSLGVKFSFNSEVTGIETAPDRHTLVINGSRETYDYVVAAADYHHVEQELLPEDVRRYSKKYWQSRTLAPSCLIYYIGVRRKVDGLLHHNLFFDADFDKHAQQIYDTREWPSSPQFYVCCPSKTDDSVAPAGMENIFVLIPVAPGLTDSVEVRRHYFAQVVKRMQRVCDLDESSIVFQRSYAHADFCRDYHAFKGQAYGLANTLGQTAHLKPSIVNKKLPNLFYAGQLTVPGPGVPPALISGQLVASQLLKSHQNKRR